MMKDKNIKYKRIALYLLFILLTSFSILIALNISFIRNYRIDQRNDERKEEIKIISQGVVDYINEENNVPYSSTLSGSGSNEFLPILIFIDNYPAGGVGVNTLQKVDKYFNRNLKDPSGSPYFIGMDEEGKNVMIYTIQFEERNSRTRSTFFMTIDINYDEKGNLTAKINK